MSDQIVKPDAIGTTPDTPPVVYTKEHIDSAAAAARREAEAKLQEAQTRLSALEAKEAERKQAQMTELEKLQAERDEFRTKFEATTAENEKFKTDQEARDKKETEKITAAVEGLTESQKAIIEALPLYSRMDAVSEFKQIKAPGMSGGGKGNGVPGIMSIEAITELRRTDPILAMKEYEKRRKALQ